MRKYILLCLLLSGCLPDDKTLAELPDKKPKSVLPELIDSVNIGYRNNWNDTFIIKYDGCTYIVIQIGDNGIAIIHHAACTNNFHSITTVRKVL